MRALLVDDEPPARRRLRSLLAAHPSIEILGEAGSVTEAVHAIEALSPELLFLDVQLGALTAFELFERTRVTARVVFVTAYEAFAVRAFEVNALDYLLKPVDAGQLARALMRLQGPRAATAVPAVVIDQDQVVVKVDGGARFVPVENIVCVRAQDDYAELSLADGTKLLSSEPLHVWEDRLPSMSFLRIHRSTIVRTRALDRLERVSSTHVDVYLRGSREPLAVGRVYLAKLRARFGL